MSTPISTQPLLSAWSGRSNRGLVMIFVSPPSPTFLCSRFISTHSLFFLWQLLREGGVRLYWAQRYAPPFAVGSGRRQAEGIAAAKAKGVRFGGPPPHPPRPRIPILFTSVGKWEKSLGRQQQRNVGCPLLPSVTGQRFTKKPSCCKRGVFTEMCTFLQRKHDLFFVR